MYVARSGLGATGGQASGGPTPVEAGLISAGVSLAVSLLAGPIKKLITGCGPSCVVTSGYANQAEALLQQNINTYMAQPTPRAASVQAAFLANFDAIWNHLEQQCAAVGGAAGSNCIANRAAGACQWKQRADSVPAWGTPAAGECWNWWNGYRSPISDDPNVVPDDSLAAVSSTADSAVASVASATGISSTWLLAGAAMLVGFLILRR